MSEMVERARGIVAAARGCPYECPDLSRCFCADTAREIIRAMREPTDDMKYAAIEGCDADLGLLEARQAWEAMIDAALCVSDGSPKGSDPKGLSRAAATARPDAGEAEGGRRPSSSKGETGDAS